VDVRRAKRCTIRHSPLHAIHYLERAARNSPDDHTIVGDRSGRGDLARIHAALARNYDKAGMPNRALAHRVEAVRLVKTGSYRLAVARSVNGYGMARQPSPWLDDREAFCGIQLARYVRSKRSQRLGTRAEVDMIAALLEDAWKEVDRDHQLEKMAISDKETLFRATVIVFPFLSVPDGLHGDDLAIDFFHGSRVGRNDRCACGSLLPYKMCHGRIPGIDELLVGDF
jgi:hypothetical protein